MFKGILFSNYKIRNRLILYYAISIILMAAVNLYSYYSVNLFIGKIDETFKGNVKLNTLHQKVYEVERGLEDYLSSKYSKSLDNYYRCTDNLKNFTDSFSVENMSGENTLLVKDIKGMIFTLLEETDAAVMARRGRDIDKYTHHYDESIKIYGYINDYINLLNNTSLQQNINRYNSVSKNFSFVELLNIGIIIVVLIFNVVLILGFTYIITKPITELSLAADAITKGIFDYPSVEVDSKDELGVLASAFNRMKGSIVQYVNEIKEKAELEHQLKERELENLIMKSSLKEAELHALQAQINPHFLFNTLNAGAQLAMFEGADKVGQFIENTAELFRYNLRNIDKPVTLEDEINNTKNYIYILKVRFADKICFSCNVDESVLGTKIPCMILQPIVENAFIHGIGDMETGGKISLTANKINDFIHISILDNGRGMTEERIMEVMNNKIDNAYTDVNNHKGHTNGIGINNILNRLKLFYGTDDIAHIDSWPGLGTDFTLKIPQKIGIGG